MRRYADEPAVRALVPTDRSTAAISRLRASCGSGGSRRGEADAAPKRPAAPRCSLAETCADDRVRFLDAVALATEADVFDPRADRVSLLTLHAAKGLEFPVVFIVGLEDGRAAASLRASRTRRRLAEERRLFYVGMTRARDRLVLSRAKTRHWRGRVRELAASPFLDDIEQELVKHQKLWNEVASKKTYKSSSYQLLFPFSELNT